MPRKKRPLVKKPLAGGVARSELDHAWVRGFAFGLAEAHRSLIGASHDRHIERTVNAAGLTLRDFELAGVSDADLERLHLAITDPDKKGLDRE